MLNARRLTLALLLLFAALIFFICQNESGTRTFILPGSVFVRTRGTELIIGNRPFRFVGANVAVIYGETEREQMPETLRAVRASGVRVVRVWAHGEWDAESAARAPNGWLQAGAFRYGRDGWNEAAFVHLDRTLAEAARLDLRVQLCLANWWRDTGGVAQYLAWAGRGGAADNGAPFRINTEAAMEFYTDPEARRLYRAHIERILNRRNTVTGTLYRDDPTIFAYELMNEAQSLPGREAERRAWVDEMSRFAKTLDANHLITPGLWGYRTARERREWVADHALAAIDFCDVHVYPRDDADSFVDSPAALSNFIKNRMAAALSLRKPLVFGEFGMVKEGFAGVAQEEWFKAYFESASRAGIAGAFFWIATPDEAREYGVLLAAERDRDVRREVERATTLFIASEGTRPAPHLFDRSAYLVPHTTSYVRSETDDPNEPLITPSVEANGRLIYRFASGLLMHAEFEKLGRGTGYVWGAGVGFFKFTVPSRDGWRMADEVIVRAHLQPVPPANAPETMNHTRVTLFVNDVDCGSRIVTLNDKPTAVTIQEWRITNFTTRLAAMLGRPLTLRFSVAPDADLPFGLNLSNFPTGYDAKERAPLVVEIR